MEGHRIYQFLCECSEPVKAPVIVAALNLTRSQVTYKLKKLTQTGLVYKPARGLYAVTERLTLHEVDQYAAEHFGKAGRGRKRQQQHIQDRQRFTSQKIMQFRKRREPENYPMNEWQCHKCRYRQWFAEDVMPGLCTRCHDGFFKQR